MFFYYDMYKSCYFTIFLLYYFTYIFFKKKMVSRNSNKTTGEQEVCKEETSGDETLVRCVRL